MNRFARCAAMIWLLIMGVGLPVARAQQSASAEPQAPNGPVQIAHEVVPALPVPRLMKVAGTFKDDQGKPRTGIVGVTFAIYKDQEGGAALWLETQNVQLDEQGRYTVLLGATKNEGIPLELFTSGEPRWLTWQVQLPGEVEQPRVLLVSVPYALKAADAETLGGIPASAFVLAQPVTPSGTAGLGTSGAAQKGPTPKQATTKRLGSSGSLPAPGPISGSGTPGQVAKFTTDNFHITDSAITEVGGNVGFGTLSPFRPLHILSAAPVIRLEDTHLPNSFWEMQQSAFVFDTFGFVRYENNAAVEGKSFVVSNAGNLGIGTGTPQRKLHIRSSAPVIRLEDTTVPNSFWELQQSAFFVDTFGFVRYENSAAVPAKSFVMSSAGNFGIGTVTPSQKLEVAGNVKISGGGNALVFPDGTVMTSAGAGTNGGTITGVTAGTGLSGGGTSGGVTLNNTGVLSFNGRPGMVTPTSGDYSFSQISGAAVAAQLPAASLVHAITYLAGCDSCSLLTNADSQNTIYVDLIGGMTINSVTCFSDAGAPAVNIQVDHGGTLSNILSSNLTCSTNGATSSSFSTSALSLNDTLNFLLVADGVAKRVTTIIKATVN